MVPHDAEDRKRALSLLTPDTLVLIASDLMGLALERRRVVGDLVDALLDELAHEVSHTPHVAEHVRGCIDWLGEGYESYLDHWALGGES